MHGFQDKIPFFQRYSSLYLYDLPHNIKTVSYCIDGNMVASLNLLYTAGK